MAWKSPFYKGISSPYVGESQHERLERIAKEKQEIKYPSNAQVIVIEHRHTRQRQPKQVHYRQTHVPILTKKQKKALAESGKKFGGFLKRKLKEKIAEKRHGKKVFQAKETKPSFTLNK